MIKSELKMRMVIPLSQIIVCKYEIHLPTSTPFLKKIYPRLYNEKYHGCKR